ncbi:MAG: hypothetical protein WKG07_48930 [Hymenobacter sp.]
MAQLAWMARPDGHIYWYNKRWYDYTGTASGRNGSWGWDKVHHPDYVQQVVADPAQGWANGPALGADLRATRPGRPVPLVSDPRRAHRAMSRAALVRWLGTNTDITEMRQLQEQLQDSLRRYLKTRVAFPANLELEHEGAGACAREGGREGAHTKKRPPLIVLGRFFVSLLIANPLGHLVLMAALAVGVAVVQLLGGGGAHFLHLAVEVHDHAGQRVVEIHLSPARRRFRLLWPACGVPSLSAIGR